MHKPEAAKLFALLGDEDRVKILKMLYNKGDLAFVVLISLIGCEESKLSKDIELLKQANLIKEIKEQFYSANKELIDELMNFVRTPCKCSNK